MKILIFLFSFLLLFSVPVNANDIDHDSVPLLYGKLDTNKTKSSTKSLKKSKVIEEPVLYKAYIVVDAETNMVLEGLNTDLPRPLASLTKIMLACVVVDKVNNNELNLNNEIIIPKKVEKIGGSSVFLKAGEIFTLEELMRAVLIESANDASYVVAEYAAGSITAFIALMNKKAQELNMNNTIFNSVHGLPPTKGGNDNISTCSDMVKLSKEALKSEKILEWTSMEYSFFRSRIIFNHNKLLGKLPEIVDGIKTGFTRRAGFNIVATGKNDERRIIVVVLGSPMPKIRDSFAIEKFQEYLIKGEGG